MSSIDTNDITIPWIQPTSISIISRPSYRHRWSNKVTINQLKNPRAYQEIKTRTKHSLQQHALFTFLRPPSVVLQRQQHRLDDATHSTGNRRYHQIDRCNPDLTRRCHLLQVRRPRELGKYVLPLYMPLRA
ncbi:hypothetical protein N7G274_000702 [Stereocaulon virgatum]|uniref:Uncharacterized protein n=1 Tax=Stereocaulon virgatum TaxID=373712 RepID=A0ABR4APL5_9LECA